ncbi:uncharacterized protein LOC108734266 [Agrilus planipennis]|uniref:Uncharacterized protein LOC108734266 n=1 Tax=Agrilus planipennis TaxID=224129 RepID=A0A1W4WB78_AGRPL|nr:uncharacterized protein LOC108734266 [Agrilus planipennis]
MYSDNGTNFTGAENALSQLDWDEITKNSAVQRIVWRFNPPSATWWGGFWERLIGVMKQLLRRVLGRASLNFEDLLTVICDCEAAINSRPLTYESDDPKELIAITPAMFLIDQTGDGLPDCDIIDRSSLCRKLRYKQKLRDDLRRRFRNEYLGQLRSFCDKKPGRQIERGEVVLIGNDQDKRIDWPLGRVVELLPGRDNQIRLVRLVTSRGSLLRPVQRLYPLECIETSPSFETRASVPTSSLVPGKKRVVKSAGVSCEKSRVPVKTRSGRVCKPPQRFSY